MRGTRLWLVIGIVALLASALVAAGCGDDDDDGGDGETTAASGDGSRADQRGHAVRRPRHPLSAVREGQPPNATGYDVDVLNAIAENLGLRSSTRTPDSQTIFRDVAAGQFDTAAAASTIKPGREKVVDFTDPYYRARLRSWCRRARTSPRSTT